MSNLEILARASTSETMFALKTHFSSNLLMQSDHLLYLGENFSYGRNYFWLNRTPGLNYGSYSIDWGNNLGVITTPLQILSAHKNYTEQDIGLSIQTLNQLIDENLVALRFKNEGLNGDTLGVPNVEIYNDFVSLKEKLSELSKHNKETPEFAQRVEALLEAYGGVRKKYVEKTDELQQQSKKRPIILKA